MQCNPFGHVDLRVTHFAEVLPFYSKLLPALGFTRTFNEDRWKVFAADGELPSCPFIAITEDEKHLANANRIAFWVKDRAKVDGIGAKLAEFGAKAIEGPAACPESSKSYYAVYFEDPCSNRWEVYHRTD